MISKFSQNLRFLRSVAINLGSHRGRPSVRSIPVLLTGTGITLLLLLIRSLGWLQGWELVCFDRLVRWQGDRGPDPRLLIVTITEADIEKLGSWPLSDQIIAQTLAKLQEYQPKTIGLDLYRNVPLEPGHRALVHEFQAPNLVTITNLKNLDEIGVPPPPNVPPNQVGFNDLLLDADGVVRRSLLFMSFLEPKGDPLPSLSATDPQPTATVYSLALRLVLQYLRDTTLQPQQIPNQPGQIRWGKQTFAPLKTNDGGYINLDTQGYQILLNYRSPRQIARQLSITQVLQGNLDATWVKDKIVLIGTTTPSTKDLSLTPYSFGEKDIFKMPGVLLQAQMLSQFLDAILDGRSLFWFWPEWLEMVWIGVWSIAGCLVTWHIQHPAKLALAGCGALTGLFAFGLGLFSGMAWIPLATPALGFAIAVASITAYKQLYSAFHDRLTGLPNRALFSDRLKGALQNSHRHLSRLAVLYLDLDRFKVINNSLGHSAGDDLLIAIVGRLKGCIRTSDTVARVGGDDFALLLENIQDIDNATHVAERIHQALVSPFNLKGQEVFMTVSIGIAVGGNLEGVQKAEERPEYLLRDAHTAMYRAKAQGTGRYQVFDTTMRALAIERLQLETDLRIGLKQQQFVLHYQPFVSLRTGKIIGFEALVRWQHPTLGLISPLKFIPVAEETGLIVPLGLWVLREACQQLRIWQQQFPSQSPLMMSVNLSGKQFSQSNLLEQITEILRETSVDAEYLKLEITESVVMEDVEAAIAVLYAMKALNVQLGIDDFGTGYSSLSYLSRFPTDTLKVDKSFVSRMESDGESELEILTNLIKSKTRNQRFKVAENVAIVRTIIMLAHALGMDVIAEGVETAEQLTKLRLFGCEYGQGYFFSKPLPSEEMTSLLESPPKW